MAETPLVVGIDLGTTHTVVAWTDPAVAGRAQIFELPQLVTAAETEARKLLPSFAYAPLPGEIANDPFGDQQWVVGEYARRRGTEVPSRLVASAKSWLCHSGVDRNAAILPWGAPADQPRQSPVEASVRLLTHVRKAWDAAHPERPLAEQAVILTVPASFDEVARELTVTAAQRAGLAVRLLEEPQAAFYDYLAGQGRAEIAELAAEQSGPALVLVCDVGGGTTDLTLIRVSRSRQGEPELARVAVGRHLLLGGDNIDLALAHACEARLVEPPERLDETRFAALVHACRAAKERLLGDDPPAEVPIRVLGTGSALVGSTLSTSLGREEVERIVLEGFLPLTPRGRRPEPRRTGLVAFGLPYEHDPAITHHVAEFLERHLGPGERPHALLLNGGFFRARRVTDKLVEALAHWGGVSPRVLAHTDPDLAVARGAVAYGLALQGRGLTIHGGTAHGYYVAVESDGGAPRAVCVVPRGAAEGERHRASALPLALRLGRPVRFELYASDAGEIHRAGQITSLDPEQFTRLAPLVASFGEGEQGETRVVLEGELSAIGTVELSCVEQLEQGKDGRRFRLAFDLRQESERASQPPPQKPSERAPVSIGGQRLAQAEEAVLRVFGKGRKDVKPSETRDLIRELERLLGERASWPVELNRTLVDRLIPLHGARRRSPDHERVYWMLTGYCLRPGFGHPRDPERVQALFPLFEQGLAFPGEQRGWQQFFIAWRRIAPGLDEESQVSQRNLIDPYLAPAEHKLKRPKSFRPLAPDELLEFASWLERVPSGGRELLGKWLIDRTWSDRDPRLWAAIGRIGARIPNYASAHYVVSRQAVERWVDELLREKWDEVSSAAKAATQMARVTNDRTRDLSEAVRAEVAARLEKVGAPAEWVAQVRSFVPLAAGERAGWFEDLPAGLRILDEN